MFEVQGLENRVFGRVVVGPGVWPLDFAVEGLVFRVKG